MHFSCRIPRCARSRDPPVNIIESLKAYARLPEGDIADDEGGTAGIKSEDDGTADLDAAPKIPLLERLGDNFARGHVQASGGIVEKEDFEELMRRMRIGVKVAKATGEKNASLAKGKAKAIDGGQKNTLLGYFGKKAAAES